MSGDPRSQILLSQIGSLPDVRGLPQVRMTRGPPLRRARGKPPVGRTEDAPPFVDFPDDGVVPMEGVTMGGGTELPVMNETLPAHAMQPEPMEGVETTRERNERLGLEAREREQDALADNVRKLLEENRRHRTAKGLRNVPAIEGPKEVVMRDAPGAVVPSTPKKGKATKAIEGSKEVVMRDAPGAVVPAQPGLAQRLMEGILHNPGPAVPPGNQRRIEGPTGRPAIAAPSPTSLVPRRDPFGYFFRQDGDF